MEPLARVQSDSTPDSAAGSVPTVLVVTDDRDLRESAKRTLGCIGFDVTTAVHAGHALLVCLGGDRIDVLITELTMRDTSGPALAERLRRYQPGLRAVYLAQPGTPARPGVVVRPFTDDDLARALGRALAEAAA